MRRFAGDAHAIGQISRSHCGGTCNVRRQTWINRVELPVYAKRTRDDGERDDFYLALLDLEYEGRQQGQAPGEAMVSSGWVPQHACGGEAAGQYWHW